MRGPRRLDEAETCRLPQPPLPAITPAGFVACPIVLQQGQGPAQWHCQQALYRLALERAQAVARPALPERRLLDVWN